jgi:putative redox protein
MDQKHVALKFTQTFSGTLTAPNAQVAIGAEEGTLAPYDMLLGALGSCLYATFLDIVNKKRLTFEGAEISIDGVKRESVPKMLETVKITVTITGASKEKGFDQALQLATEYCSVFQTIAKVAAMSYTLAFQ